MTLKTRTLGTSSIEVTEMSLSSVLCGATSPEQSRQDAAALRAGEVDPVTTAEPDNGGQSSSRRAEGTIDR